MLIIDFHTHCFPDSIAGRALGTLSEKAAIPFFHNGTAEGLDAFEREGGCDGYVVLPIATNPGHTTSVNRFASGIQNPERNVYAFGSIHPDNADYKEQLRIIKGLGLRGVKLHPEYQSFHINDEKLFPIYEEIFSLGLPLLFHAGEDLGFFPPWHSDPHRIAEIAGRYPEALIIAAHMGGFNMESEAVPCLTRFPNVYIDVSFSAGFMPEDDFRRLCGMWGGERLLFGSDSPWQPVRESIKAVKGLPCPDSEKEMIFSGNALRILGGGSR